MVTSWRLPAAAAIALLALGAGTASAQTVFVRHAPASRVIDVVVNRAPAGKGTADEDGNAKIPISLSTAAGKPAMDANVFVDICADLTRVLVEEGGTTPPAPGVGCERRDVQGLYAVKAESTLVVNVGGATPSMLLIQGSYTPPKPSEERPEGASDEPRPHRPASTGLALYAGGALTKVRDVVANACGNVADCTADDAGLGYAVGGVVWITKWLGAEAGYLRPSQLRATRTTDPLHFDMRMRTDLVIVAGKVAVPAGPVRIFGTFGADYHQATQDTSETVTTQTITQADGTTITVPGGTQTFQVKTKGWSYVYGGGGEVWVSHPLALYGEFNVISVKGDATGGTGGRLNDRFTSLTFGVGVRIGRKASPST